MKATTKVEDSDQVVAAASQGEGNHILGHQVGHCLSTNQYVANFRKCNMLNLSVLDRM